MTTPTPGEHPEHLEQRALIAGLAAAAGDLSSVARDLYKSAVLTRLERTIISIAIVLLLLSTILSTVMVVALRGTAETLSKLAESNNQNTAIIRDCTQPGGNCYQQGRDRAGITVELINRNSIAANFCSLKEPTFTTAEDFKRCVDAELARMETEKPIGGFN